MQHLLLLQQHQVELLHLEMAGLPAHLGTSGVGAMTIVTRWVNMLGNCFTCVCIIIQTNNVSLRKANNFRRPHCCVPY